MRMGETFLSEKKDNKCIDIEYVNKMREYMSRIMSLECGLLNLRLINIVSYLAYRILEIMLYGVLASSLLMLIASLYIQYVLQSSMPYIVEQIYMLIVMFMLGGGLVASIIMYSMSKLRRSFIKVLDKIASDKGDK